MPTAFPTSWRRKRKLKARIFRDLGERYQVCPFELQLEGAREADVVICDYNYVFAPRSALGRVRDLGIDQTGKPNLVIDEAHNLPARAMDYLLAAPSPPSPLRGCARRLRELPARFRREAEELLDGCLQAVGVLPAGGKGRARADRSARGALSGTGGAAPRLSLPLSRTPTWSSASRTRSCASASTGPNSPKPCSTPPIPTGGSSSPPTIPIRAAAR